MKAYLTETNLNDFLKQIFPDIKFIHDSIIPNSSSRSRPDYRSDELKLIVEYDGPEHYKNAEKIKKEIIKDSEYKKMGYKVIHIPYFVQISSTVIKYLFDVDIKVEQIFDHGFITTSHLPADFCDLGIMRFKDDLQRFKFIKSDIIKSLKDKVVKSKDIATVLPPSLVSLFDE